MLRDELGTVFGDDDFAALFPDEGQPALPPWRLALVTLMQFRENLSDRQAAETLRSETSFSVMQARLLYQYYRQLCQSERWRSLPEGVEPLRLVWDCTDIPPEAGWRYLQTLSAPETVMMLPPSTLEMYREVSLLPTRLTDDERVEQILTSGSRELALDERIDQLVNEDIARSALLLPLGQSLNAFHQLLDTIEQKRMR
jgi:hypothetical protein